MQHTSVNFLLQERVSGVNMFDFMLDSKVSNDTKLDVIDAIFAGLGHIFYKSGILHGDPHPGNFLVSLDKGSCVVWAIDWGNAVKIPHSLMPALKNATAFLAAINPIAVKSLPTMNLDLIHTEKWPLGYSFGDLDWLNILQIVELPLPKALLKLSSVNDDVITKKSKEYAAKTLMQSAAVEDLLMAPLFAYGSVYADELLGFRYAQVKDKSNRRKNGENMLTTFGLFGFLDSEPEFLTDKIVQALLKGIDATNLKSNAVMLGAVMNALSDYTATAHEMIKHKLGLENASDIPEMHRRSASILWTRKMVYRKIF
jgi:serine/threonine protein kinase